VRVVLLAEAEAELDDAAVMPEARRRPCRVLFERASMAGVEREGTCRQAEGVCGPSGEDAQGPHSEEYETQAQRVYGLLREAWERAVEEILLNGVVERFRNSVETHRARNLARITDEDVRVIDRAMSKCSTWLPGHDQAAAQNTPIPGPEELVQDIEELESWVRKARKRLAP
jgi:hypothetical protein